MNEVNLSDLKNKKIALVLSGGVVKASAWHLGVALAMEEIGFSFKSNTQQEKSDLEVSTYVGSSAGGMVSTLLASGFNPKEIIDGALGINKKSSMKKLRYKDVFYLDRKHKRPPKSDFYRPLQELPFGIRHAIRPFLSTPGLFSTEGVRNYLLKCSDASDRFEDFAPDLFIVTTQLDHSRKVIFSKYTYPNPGHDSTATYYTGTSVSEAVAASMSVPPFYTPYPIKNPLTNQMEYYIDGEIRETLSTHVAEDNGCDIVISSWTHTPYHYHSEVGSLVNYGLPSIIIQSIYLLIQKKIVASRAQRATAIDILNTVNEYLKKEKFSTKHRQDLMAILEQKLNTNPNVKLIDIYPDHHDYKLFFANSFSLNPHIASHAVKMGYKKAMEIFKNNEIV